MKEATLRETQGLPRRTAKTKKRTAKALPCVFYRGAQQKAHGSFLHGKAPLPCAASDNARQIIFAVRFFPTHGKKAIDGVGTKRRGTPFAVRQEKTHGKGGLFAVRRGKTHGKDLPLP
jgi:hypothetical protein